jgi:hypothetical protein
MCSAHRQPMPGCVACHTQPREVFPDWDRKLAEAEASGQWQCPKDGFEWYGTIKECLICGHPQTELISNPG